MGLEIATLISELNQNWPLGTDGKSEGDDHLRLIKKVLQAAFDDGTAGTMKLGKTLQALGLILDVAAAATARNITGKVAGSNRWLLQLGDGTAEDWFNVARYTDGGALINLPIRISRSNGRVAVENLYPSNGFFGTNGTNKLLFNWNGSTPTIDIDGATGAKLLWSGQNSSFTQTSPGMCLLPNGLKFCWGSFSTGAAGDVYQPYPSAYSAYSTAFVNVNYSGGGQGVAMVGNATEVGTAGFNIRVRTVSAGSVAMTTNCPVNWCAIGF